MKCLKSREAIEELNADIRYSLVGEEMGGSLEEKDVALINCLTVNLGVLLDIRERLTELTELISEGKLRE